MELLNYVPVDRMNNFSEVNAATALPTALANPVSTPMPNKMAFYEPPPSMDHTSDYHSAPLSTATSSHGQVVHEPFELPLNSYRQYPPPPPPPQYAFSYQPIDKVKSHSMPLIDHHSYTDDFKLRQMPMPQQPAPSSSSPSNVLQRYVQGGMSQYPDMTTMVNSNSNMVLPMVESQFVDHRVCNVCGKRITRDMSRHSRTHLSVSRFTCKFPKNQCRHKSGRFNRPYDFKKHLLNRHFKFDNPEVRKLHNLLDKLDHWGTCPCGLRFLSKDWLDDHILTDDASKKCPYVE